MSIDVAGLPADWLDGSVADADVSVAVADVSVDVAELPDCADESLGGVAGADGALADELSDGWLGAADGSLDDADDASVDDVLDEPLDDALSAGATADGVEDAGPQSTATPWCRSASRRWAYRTRCRTPSRRRHGPAEAGTTPVSERAASGAPPDAPPSVLALSSTLPDASRVATSRVTELRGAVETVRVVWAVEAVSPLAPHTRPLECWCRRLLMTPSIFDPAPMFPGG